jgi:protein-disulfide isomerase
LRTAAPAPAAVRKIDVPDSAPAKGPKHAKVTIVEWSDFQCPFCSRVEPTLKQIEDTYSKDVRIIWRNQPLPFHQNAKPAAEAAMAAHEQGKFWPMHDKIYANQQSIDRASLEKYAQEIGLDMGKFKAALDSGKFRAAIEADSAKGNEVGANGTPTFFINGREFVGAQPFESFKNMIDEEIKHADKVLATGVKMDQLYEKVIEDGIKNAPAAPAGGGAAPPPTVANIEVGDSPVKGPKNAPVTIVMFSDFQCPFCSRVEPTLAELEKQYAGKVRIAWKNQPLPFHQNARPAAIPGPREPREVRLRDRPRHGQVQVGARLEQVRREDHGRLERGQQGRRERHPDVLHQRPPARRRAADRPVQVDHRRRAEEEEVSRR